MKRSERRKLEAKIFRALRQREIDVSCGRCGAVSRAAWRECVIRTADSWIAGSLVRCVCGCNVQSWIGDADGLRAILEADQAKDGLLAVERGRSDLPSIVASLKRALAE